jgi:hypothetical protein
MRSGAPVRKPKLANGGRDERQFGTGLTAEIVVVALVDIEDYQAFEAASRHALRDAEQQCFVQPPFLSFLLRRLGDFAAHRCRGSWRTSGLREACSGGLGEADAGLIAICELHASRLKCTP